LNANATLKGNIMPSQKTASPKKQRCEVLRAIGIEATQEDINALKKRADTKGLKFVSEGLTTMIFPEKRVLDRDGKTWIEPEPVFIDLDIDVARKLSKAGAVRVDF